jgi:hypothetical protein
VPHDWLKLRGVTRNNLDRVDIDIPVGLFTGVSGSGKSSLISQFLVEAVAEKLGHRNEAAQEEADALDAPVVAAADDITGLGQHQTAGRGRPEGYWTNSPLEPGDIYLTSRSRPQAYCRYQTTPGPALRRR